MLSSVPAGCWRRVHAGHVVAGGSSCCCEGASHPAPQRQAVGSMPAASHLLTTTRMLSETVSELVGVLMGWGSSGLSSARRSRMAAASWSAHAARCKHAGLAVFERVCTVCCVEAASHLVALLVDGFLQLLLERLQGVLLLQLINLLLQARCFTVVLLCHRGCQRL